MPIITKFNIPMQKDHYEIIVFKTHEEMYEHRKDMNKQGYSKIVKFNFDAICSTLSIIQGKYGLFGKVLLWEESARNVKVVAHEFSHACLYWWIARVNKQFFKVLKEDPLTYGIIQETDEQFATLYGNTVDHYWSKWLKVSKLVDTEGR